MPKFSNHPSAATMKVLLVGDSGAGKTGAIASLANAGYKVGVIDFDNGLSILRQFVDKDKLDNIAYVSVNKTDPACWATVCDLIDKSFKDEDFDWGNVSTWGEDHVLVVDSGSFASDLALNSAKKQNNVKLDAAKFDQGIWGVMATTFEILIQNLMALKCNVVVTSHIRYTEDGKGIQQAFPAFAGQQLLRAVPKAFNDIWRVHRDKDNNHFIKTVADQYLRTVKTSFPKVIKPEYKGLDLAEIFKGVREYNGN